jgi:type IV secretory pathway TraG/TraD family ATPase VirD4
MKNYLLMWILLTLLLFAGLYVLLCGWAALPISSIEVLFAATAVAAVILANEMRRPMAKEYNRKQALYPKIPEKYLSKEPPTGGVIFGTDHHTGKLVVEENSHVLICGSTGSGKTATCLIPSILSHTNGSAQIVDIKSRELSYKTANIYDENTQIIDLNLNKPWIWGWDLFYKLPKDGTATEQEVLKVVREVASIVVPRPTSGDAFWADAARNEFIGLTLYEFCYGGLYELVDIIHSILQIPLREHLELALNSVQKHSLVASYLTGLAAAADETLFSVDLTLSQNTYQFVSDEAVWFFRDNPKRANPTMLNREGIRQYLCVSEEQLDSGFDKMINLVMKQTLSELQSRTTSGEYPQTTLYWDEWQRLTESVEELRQVTSSFLKTGRSKHASVVLCCQNLDNFKKEQIYDILSNIGYFYVLSSNNSNSLTSEVVCKMAGSYYEKEKSVSEGKGTSTSVSFREKQILRPEDLNNLGDDAVLIITNHGYVRTCKEGSAYYKTAPFRSQYEKILAVNRDTMDCI